MGVVLHRPIIVFLLDRKSQPNVTRLCSLHRLFQLLIEHPNDKNTSGSGLCQEIPKKP